MDKSRLFCSAGLSDEPVQASLEEEKETATTPESSEEWGWGEDSDWWQGSSAEESGATSENRKKHGDHWRRIDESK